MLKRPLALLLPLVFTSACLGPTREERLLKVGLFSTYNYPELAQKFETEFGIPVEIHSYETNEELISKLEAHAVDLDVFVASDYAIPQLTRKALISALDSEDKQQLRMIDPRFLAKHFDPTNERSIPMAWGTTGIATHLDLRKNPVGSWKELFTDPSLTGKFTLLDDMRETIGAALKLQGKSMNETSAASLSQAEATLSSAFSRARMIQSQVLDHLLQKEIVAAHIFSNMALMAVERSKGRIAYLIPKEGGTLWIDNFVISSETKKRESIRAWLRYMVNPTTAQIFSDHAKTGTVVKDVPGVQLPTEKLKELDEIVDLAGATSLYETLWKRLSIFARI